MLGQLAQSLDLTSLPGLATRRKSLPPCVVITGKKAEGAKTAVLLPGSSSTPAAMIECWQLMQASRILIILGG